MNPWVWCFFQHILLTFSLKLQQAKIAMNFKKIHCFNKHWKNEKNVESKYLNTFDFLVRQYKGSNKKTLDVEVSRIKACVSKLSF